MSRDKGQTEPSRCFGKCEREELLAENAKWKEAAKAAVEDNEKRVYPLGNSPYIATLAALVEGK